MRSPLRFSALILLVTSTAFGQKPPKAEPEVDAALLPLVKQLKDKDTKVRLEAAAQLGEKGEGAASAATALCLALQDPSPKVSEAALVALEKVRPDLYKPLSGMLLDRNRFKQFTAIAALGELGEKAAPVKQLLLAWLRKESVSAKEVGLSENGRFLPDEKIGGVRVTREDSAVLILMTALEQIDAGNADVLKTRKLLAGPANKSHESRLEAIDELIRWADSDERKKEILPLVGALLQGLPVGQASGPGSVFAKERNQLLLLAGIDRLAPFGKLAKAYLPALKRLKLSSDEAVRTAATKAVDAIDEK